MSLQINDIKKQTVAIAYVVEKPKADDEPLEISKLVKRSAIDFVKFNALRSAEEFLERRWHKASEYDEVFRQFNALLYTTERMINLLRTENLGDLIFELDIHEKYIEILKLFNKSFITNPELKKAAQKIANTILSVHTNVVETFGYRTGELFISSVDQLKKDLNNQEN